MLKGTRADKRRAYNAWRKLKKVMLKKEEKELGSQFNEAIFLSVFEHKFPNPMNI